MKSEVSLRLSSMAKFLDNLSCLPRLFGFVSVLGRSFTSLANAFNIVHTFVCGNDVGTSTTNANELISDGAAKTRHDGKVYTRTLWRSGKL